MAGIQTLYVEESCTKLFARELAKALKQLRFLLPVLEGRAVPSNVPGVEHWEIKTVIMGRAADNTTETTIYTGTYPDWDGGVPMALKYALARICHDHHDEFPVGSVFRVFGRRDEDGDAMYTEGVVLPTYEKHLEDMEDYAVGMEGYLAEEMKACKEAKAAAFQQHQKIQELEGQVEMRDEEIEASKAVMHAQIQELQTAHTLIGHMEEHVHELQLENLEKDTQIAALQAQLNPPPPPVADSGEDSPARNTRARKRNCMNSRDYAKLFKKH